MQFPQYISPITSFKDTVNILKGKRIISEETISEAYEVHFSDGIKQKKTYTNKEKALAFAKELIKNKKGKGLQHVDVFNAGPNFHSTTDTDALFAWWGPGSYFDNVSKKDSSILGKQIKEETLNEAHKLTTAQIIDRLNPYAFKRGVEFEMSKEKVKDDETYQRVIEKVAKKLSKNPDAYREVQLANSKEIEKKDKTLGMVDVKDNNLKDKDNDMKKAKGQETPKKDPSSKKENKKGKPKGVKEMKGSTKKPKGVKDTFKPSGKEQVLNEIADFLKKKDSLAENSVIPTERSDYGRGKIIKTPEGEAEIIEKHGSVVKYKTQDGQEYESTLNVLDKINNPEEEDQKAKEKAERDQMWKNWDQQKYKTYAESDNTTEEKKNQLVEKIKRILSKLKMKKEGEMLTKVDPVTKKTSSVISPNDTATSSMTRLGYKKVAGTKGITPIGQ
jgi:hypothetical protein